MIIKAIIFDLDGTLLNSSHYAPAKEKKYIYKLYNRKIKIIIATGRGEDAFLLTNEIPCSGIILNNGMQIYNNDKLIKRNFIAKSKVLPMIIKLNSCGLLIGGVKSGIHYTNFNAQKMGNALDIIKKSADYVALKNDDGGISKILDELFGSNKKSYDKTNK